MLENISDYLSFALLMAFPVALILYAWIRYRRHHHAKVLANHEKYYREW